MQIKFSFYFLIICLTFLYSCSLGEDKNNEKPKNLLAQKASWLLGGWQSSASNSQLYEYWSVQNDTVFSGVGYVINGKDTGSKENIKLELHGQDLYSIPSVNNQNEGKPISFKLTSAENQKLVFENPQHDFPQKITYELIKEDSLVATISGLIEKDIHSQYFPMKRIR